MLVQPSVVTAPGQPTLHKQAFHSLAKCVAAITVIYKHEALVVVEQFVKEIINATNDAQHIFALLIVGEIGRHMYVAQELFFVFLAITKTVFNKKRRECF